MKQTRRTTAAALSLGAVLACTAASADAATSEKTLYTFDGATADAPLGIIQARDGNFYGATAGGGIVLPTFFRMTPKGEVTTLVSSAQLAPSNPISAAPVQGRDGSFYLNTRSSIVRITPDGSLTTLHQFSAAASGTDPVGALVQGADGAFYGVTIYGGTNASCSLAPWYGDLGCGTIFRVTAAGEFTSLYSFDNSGAWPITGLTPGADGALYGMTQYNFDSSGNVAGVGNVFRITPQGRFSTVHAFGNDESGVPVAPLTLGGDGNFYGVSTMGGSHFDGDVFKLTPQGDLTVLYSFTCTADGGGPATALVQDPATGTLLGTTGGSTAGCPSKARYGTLFSITPSGQMTTLFRFNGTNGDLPNSLVRSASGKFLYGSAWAGGPGAFVSPPYGGTLFRFASKP